MGYDPNGKWNWGKFLLVAGINAFSGLLSYHGAMVGGIVGLKIPGVKFNLYSFIKYHTMISQIVIYFMKITLAYIKSKLKECN